MFDTIVALATPQIKSALGIIRLSGENCFTIVNNFFNREIKFKDKNKIFYGYIVDKEKEETIDEVILLAYKNPYSFTGEDSVEIICHGSPLIFEKIIELSIKFGARLAKGGEYSFRSYVNGKIDLIQAESINDLINAESLESQKLSLLSLQGKTSKLIAPLKEDFASLLSNIEVNIDYPEYQDIEVITFEKIVEICNKNLKYIENLINNGQQGKIIKDGINIAIVGKPNVGKSSLLNSFLNEDKAIVSSIKGTTRDVVEGKINLNGIIINFFDTAGIRESDNEIEEIGILKSKQKIESSDLVIVVFDSTDLSNEDEEILDLVKNKKHIVVYNKKDKLTNLDDDKIYISALKNDINILKEQILKIFKISKDNYENPSINNARELGILQNIKKSIIDVLNEVQNKTSIDLISVMIKDIYLEILSLTGEDCDFDITKEIFSRFCVGK